MFLLTSTSGSASLRESNCTSLRCRAVLAQRPRVSQDHYRPRTTTCLTVVQNISSRSRSIPGTVPTGSKTYAMRREPSWIHLHKNLPSRLVCQCRVWVGRTLRVHSRCKRSYVGGRFAVCCFANAFEALFVGYDEVSVTFEVLWAVAVLRATTENV